LAKLQRAGKIARIGVSNFSTAHLSRLIDAGVPIATNQPQYSPIDLRPENAFIPACREHGIVQLCYGTLAGGFLASDWLGAAEPSGPFENRSLTKYKLIIEEFGGWDLFQELLRTLHGIAGRHGRSIAQIALRWILDRPNVAAAIVGATSTRHIAENTAVFDFALDEDDHAAIAAVVARRQGPAGDCYDLERDKDGRHGRIMRYDQSNAEG
ncbi:MAG: aldo/keto reductase, partial [Rhodospirillaceae bacterium]|nr:aldo/keto reductase [Rhodospirillaceae bacterium]